MDDEFADKYAGNLLPMRATNYPAKLIPYIAILAVAKFLRSFGIFLSYDILKLIHVIPFLFLVKAGSALCFVLIQKPFTGRKISKRLWLRIARHAFLGSVIQLLWLYGLTLCGPLRTLLLFEHSDMVVIAAASALFTSSSSPSKFRGAVVFLFAFLSIMLFDHDLDKVESHGSSHDQLTGHRHESVISHVVNHLTGLTGLSDHKAGVVLLLITLCLTVGYNMASKNLSLDIGGAKRLHALSALISAVLLAPWAGFITYSIDSRIESWLSAMFPVALVTLLVMVADYYIEAACVNRLDVTRTSRLGTVFVLGSALFLAAVWNHPFIGHITNTQSLKEVITEEHEISAGVLFSIGLFALATYVLMKPMRGSKGNFVGYSAAGPPLYNFAGDALHRTSHSVLVILKNGLRQILEESDSRSIFFFLCVNLSFTFVELIYGAWTNSLGLISDGFHMLFDCSALVMGLYAAVMSHWKPTRIFSYGFDRVEILSGFINAIFLIVIAFFVFTAAIVRILDPPDIITDRLLIVSVGGLLVNLVGIFSFHHGHSHGSSGGHGHSHGGGGHSHSGTAGHGHSHAASSGGQHGHSHGKGQSCATSGQSLNTNLQGVFLHILADTLGSVGVIVSTLLIENFGWKIADPLCSLFISVLIFVSVLPLLKETSLILLQRTPVEIQQALATVFHKVLSLEGVDSYSEEHFWRHSSKVVCGTIHIQIDPTASEQKIVSQVSALFREAGVTNLCLQVEKRSFIQHLSGLGVSSDRISIMTRSFKTVSHSEDFAVGRS